jgi:WD40 repeat protein
LANKDQEGELKSGDIKQVQAWTAHKDIVRSITYINKTDEPLVFTAGMDRMAYIWDLNKNCKGKLIQGYMLKKNYFWEFPLNNYEREVDARVKAQ